MPLPMNTIAARIERVQVECRGCWASYGIDSFERARLEEWKNLRTLTEKQTQVLERIETKVFGDDG